MNEVHCPHCLAQTPIPSTSNGSGQSDGEIVDCSHCDRSFALPVAAAVVPDALAAAPIDWVAAGVTDPKQAGASTAAPTEVPIALSGVAGLLLTIIFYVAVVGPLASSYFGQLFSARGWVPYGIALLAGWSIVMLAFKTWRVLQQRRCLETEFLPTSIAARINADNAHVFTSYLRHASIGLPRNFLSERLEGATLFLGARRSNSAVAEHLTRQSEADANAVDSSYTTLRVFIWAIPILGFIGTVLGIGTAVGAFSATVSAAVDLEVMKQSIGAVATGLGVAFDTTLLALVTSIVLMFPMSWLQKFEESLLARVDDYCDTQLSRRLEELPGLASRAEAAGNNAAAADANLEALSVSVGRSLRELDTELSRLSKSVGSLSEQLADRKQD